MRQWLRSHLTYANVMATLAVFLVLGGGTALGAYVVSSNSQIGPNTVSGHKPPTDKHANIIGGSINGTDLATSAVTGSKIAANAVTGAKVLNDSLTRDDINEATLSGVTPGGTAGGDLTGTYPNPSVADGAITPEKLNAGLTFTDAGLQEGLDCGTVPEGWYEAPGQPVAFARDPFGIVHLRGVVVKCSNSSNIAFFLPPGFRPASTEAFVGQGSSAITPGVTTIQIRGVGTGPSEGGVNPSIGFQGSASLSGITFRCAPSGQDGCP